MENFDNKFIDLLSVLYKDETLKNAKEVFEILVAGWETQRRLKGTKLSERDVVLITYGDGITDGKDKPLRVLKRFLDSYCHGEITNVHLLPVFPSTSDDGFAVSDYRKIDERLGDWHDIGELGKSYGLMLDAVINHSSRSHSWFKACLEGVEEYKAYYIESDPGADYSLVTRPRALPLLTKFATADGEKYYWTTFSDDQVDLNYSNPVLLAEIADIVLFYASRGVKFIRLDAIGFIFKKSGTSCMHLEEAHAVVKLLRLLLEYFFPGTYIVTETNVPHEDNISYFGSGDEAHLVYQFPLPPLIMFSLQSGDATKLTQWAQSLESTPLDRGNTYFNFLASHDGVGVRPIEGILSDAEREFLFETAISNGGKISYRTNADGSVSPYELNISFMDGISNRMTDKTERFKRFMAAQAIMLSLQGVPGIYYHSLLGSGNWYAGAEASGINRRINREKLDYGRLTEELEDKSSLRYMVLSEYKRLLSVRGRHSAFSPYAGQKILNFPAPLFAVERHNEITGEKIVAVVNVCNKAVELEKPIEGENLLSEEQGGLITRLEPYQTAWISVLSRSNRAWGQYFPLQTKPVDAEDFMAGFEPETIMGRDKIV